MSTLAWILVLAAVVLGTVIASVRTFSLYYAQSRPTRAKAINMVLALRDVNHALAWDLYRHFYVLFLLPNSPEEEQVQFSEDCMMPIPTKSQLQSK